MIIGLLVLSISADQYPEVGLTVPLATVNEGLDTVAKPKLIGLIVGHPIDTNISGGGAILFQVHRVEVDNATMDFSSLLSQGHQSKCKASLRNASLTVSLNITVISKRINYPNMQIDIEDLELDLDVDMQEAKGWGFNPVLSNVKFNQERIKVKLRNSSSIDSTIVNALLVFLKGNLNKILDNIVLGLNKQLTDLSSKPAEVELQPPHSSALYIITASTLDPPNFPYQGGSLLNTSLSVSMRNTVNNATYRESEDDELYSGGLSNLTSLQFGGNLMNLLSWVIQNSGLDLVLDDSKLPLSSPVRLTCGSLAALIPSFGSLASGLGLFLQTIPQPVNQTSCNLRGGHVLCLVNTKLRFIVDLSDQYGKHTLPQCLAQQKCVLGLEFDAELMINVALKTVERSTMVANFIGVQMTGVTNVAGSLAFNAGRFQNVVNTLAQTLTNPLNEQFRAGVPIALPKKLSFVKGFEVGLGQAMGTLLADMKFK